MFVDLTAACDTVWHSGLKFTRSFTLTIGNSKRNRLRCLKNGVPQGFVLASLLFNIYISGLQSIVSRKYAYADDLAIMHVDGDCQAVEGVLTKDMATAGGSLQTWKLKLSTTNRCRQPSALTTRKLNVSLKSNTTTKPCPSALSLNTLG